MSLNILLFTLIGINILVLFKSVRLYYRWKVEVEYVQKHREAYRSLVQKMLDETMKAAYLYFPEMKEIFPGYRIVFDETDRPGIIVYDGQGNEREVPLTNGSSFVAEFKEFLKEVGEQVQAQYAEKHVPTAASQP